MKNSPAVPPDSKTADEPETPPVQIAENSDLRILSEPNIPRPQTNPRLKVQS
jgi:hypothetical protein